MSATRVTWTDFFFTPTGRFGRAQYWGASFAIIGVVIAYLVPLAIFGDTPFGNNTSVEIVYFTIGALLLVAASVANMFAIVKRFHDRDKPWPWCLIVFVPYIGGLWILVECGCLAGTDGPNSFGGDRSASLEAPGKEVIDAPGLARRRDRSF